MKSCPNQGEFVIVSVSGPPGSGKTTLAELLARKKGWRMISTGLVFRQMAKERGMTLAEFGEYACEHHEIDRELDERIMSEVERIRKSGDSVVVEGRLSGHMLNSRNIPSFKVWVDAPLEVRAERISGREKKDVDVVRAEIEERERVERERYREIYNIDLYDKSIYDLVLDSSDRSPQELLEEILEAMNR